MDPHFLTSSERRELIFWHNHREDKARYADRIKAVLRHDEGVGFEEIAKRLFLDEKTPRRWIEVYRQGGLDALIVDNYTLYAGKLNSEQTRQLYAYVDSHLFLDVYPIIAYVLGEFNIKFSPSGMRSLLHRVGFVYKKASTAPDGTSPEKQKEFLSRFTQLMATKSPDTPVLFMDSTHPQYRPAPSYGWIAKGKRAEVATKNEHQNLNITGAVNSETQECLSLFTEKMNPQTVVAFLRQIESRYSSSAHIVVICDNSGNHHAPVVREYLMSSRISLMYLPPRSPNLNIIERLWRFMHKHTINNYLHPTFASFRDELLTFFFRLSEDLRGSLKSLLALNFSITPTKGRGRQAVI